MTPPKNLTVRRCWRNRPPVPRTRRKRPYVACHCNKKLFRIEAL
jgi:hypothetical protein